MQPARRLIVAAAGAGRRELVLAIALGTAGAALVVLQAGLLARLLARGFLERARPAELVVPLAAFAAAAVARALVVWGGELCAQRFAARVQFGLRARLARHLVELGPAYVADRRTGTLGHALTGAVDALDGYLAQYLPQAALALLAPLVVLAAVAAADPLSALVLLATYPLIPLFMGLIGAQARERSERQLRLLGRLSGQFLDGLQALPLLRAFGRGAAQAARVAAAAERFREVTLGVLRLALLSALVLELLATLSVALVAVEVGLRLLYGRLAFEPALVALVLAPEFYRPLRALGAAFHAGAGGREAAAQVFEVLDLPPPAPARGSGVPPTPAPRVELRDLRYAYDAAGAPYALDGLTLTIPSAETLALVGPSGAGKSTLVQLLLRFREPQAGTILVDGRPLGELDARAWRERVAWVPQRPYLFFGTVLDNLRLGRPQASREDVERAARQAQAHELIASLPQGYDTPLGEGGARLSGGQAQRLALARAFLRDAPLLVLDEPTAQLDVEHEARLQEALDALAAGRTVLLIAHRLGTVRRADRVALLGAGRVLEQGTPAALAAAGGRYAQLLAAHEGRT